MRFDDMLATVLARRPDRPAARIAQWRQLLDIVAQRQGAGSGIDTLAIDRLNAIRATVPVSERRDAAAAIAGRRLDPAMVHLIADDVPLVAGAVLGRVTLGEDAWLSILPRLSPTARGFLRHRRDLGARVEAALASFGAVDFSLAGTIAPEVVAATDPAPPALPEPDPERPQPHEPGAGEGQIRAIINRIARFRNGRDDKPAAAADASEQDERHCTFEFETGRDGLISRVEGVPRGPLIGETIATPAEGRYGVDAQAPGAFRRRAPFRDARLTVAGDGPAAGEWRIAGVPVFAPEDGRFLGYRGSGRRPRGHERAGGASPAPRTTPPARGDSMRQLVHELRTPINAIGGFAEMIRRQLRGPVSEAYRARATMIADDAGRLLAAVDDLDLSARLDTDRLTLRDAEIDIGTVLRDVAILPEGASGDGVPSIVVHPDGGLPLVSGDLATVRRMTARLVAALSAFADGTPLAVSLDAGAADVILSFDRPVRLRGVPAEALFDPDYAPDGGASAPLLGLGFSLHLVRRLAQASGGAIDIADDAIRLRLPRSGSAFDIGAA